MAPSKPKVTVINVDERVMQSLILSHALSPLNFRSSCAFTYKSLNLIDLSVSSLGMFKLFLRYADLRLVAFKKSEKSQKCNTCCGTMDFTTHVVKVIAQKLTYAML